MLTCTASACMHTSMQNGLTRESTINLSLSSSLFYRFLLQG
jgi:hypothetical protein